MPLVYYPPYRSLQTLGSAAYSLPSSSSTSSSSASPPSISSLSLEDNSTTTATLYDKWWTATEKALAGFESERRIFIDLVETSGNTKEVTPAATASFSSPLPSHPPRYSLCIVDSKYLPHPSSSSSPSPTCSILIIPLGRENEYLFSHPTGQQSLVTSNHFTRMLFVSLGRGHTFEGGLKQVQAELRAVVGKMTGVGEVGVPFLAIATEVGKRKQVWESEEEKEEKKKSENGKLLVEDVELSNRWFRRLIFTNTGLIQSEARLTTSSPPTIDFSFLPCLYQHCILSSLSLSSQSLSSPILLVGLGGGSLAMWIHKMLPHMKLDVIEIDQQVVEIATKFFGLQAEIVNNFTTMSLETNEKKESDSGSESSESDSSKGWLRCQIADGKEVIMRSLSPSFYSTIIIDCNSLDLSAGLSFPPPIFLTSSFLSHAYSLLPLHGLLIINLGCRDEKLKAEIIGRIVEVFREGNVFELEVDPDEDVNVIITARKIDPPSSSPSSSSSSSSEVDVLELRTRSLTSDLVSSFHSSLKWDDEMDVVGRVGDIREVRRNEDGTLSFRALKGAEELEMALKTVREAQEEVEQEGQKEAKRKAKAKAKKQKQKAKKQAQAKSTPETG